MLEKHQHIWFKTESKDRVGEVKSYIGEGNYEVENNGIIYIVNIIDVIKQMS
jgi:anti-sigma28 factor (negative regulator of flagellin synthesis)